MSLLRLFTGCFGGRRSGSTVAPQPLSVVDEPSLRVEPPLFSVFPLVVNVFDGDEVLKLPNLSQDILEHPDINYQHKYLYEDKNMNFSVFKDTKKKTTYHYLYQVRNTERLDDGETSYHNNWKGFLSTLDKEVQVSLINSIYDVLVSNRPLHPTARYLPYSLIVWKRLHDGKLMSFKCHSEMTSHVLYNLVHTRSYDSIVSITGPVNEKLVYVMKNEDTTQSLLDVPLERIEFKDALGTVWMFQSEGLRFMNFGHYV